MVVFTPQEQRTILFLACLGLAGIGIDFLCKQSAGIKVVACVHENLGKIDLNTADRELLKEIPGVGEKLAQRIIDYRKAHGAFTSLEQLKEIKGFRNSTYEKAKAAVFVSEP